MKSWLKALYFRRRARRYGSLTSFRVRDRMYIAMPHGDLYEWFYGGQGDPENPSNWLFTFVCHL